jgi:hypothetical protein
MLPGDKGEVNAIVYPIDSQPSTIDINMPKEIPGLGIVRFPGGGEKNKIPVEFSLANLKPNTGYCTSIVDQAICKDNRLMFAVAHSRTKISNHFETDSNGKINKKIDSIGEIEIESYLSAVVLQEGSCSAEKNEIIACGQFVYRGIRKGIRPHFRT